MTIMTIMKTTFEKICPRRARHVLVVLCLLVGLALALPAYGQMSPEEHASHHPGQASGATSAGGTGASPGGTGAVPGGAGMGAMPAAGGVPGPGGMGPPAGVGPPGGTGGMMGGMMKKMGVPPPKELYPTLMALPELSPEQRKQVEQQADERMHVGTDLIAQALDALSAGTQADDYAAMQEAMTRLREGAAQLESGIAAQRALAEGRAPREVGLAWFKQEMNLSLAVAPTAPGRSGVTPFHLFTMVLLVAFALAMLAMYFFKMRRAAALFGRIEAGKGAPPPGSAPELAGGKSSEAEKPPSGSQAAAPPDKPAVDKLAAPPDKPATTADKPAADKPAAATDKPAVPADKPAADKPAAPPDKPATPADKPAADKPDAAADKPAADKLAAAADKPAVPSGKPAAADNKLDAAAEKLAAATEKLVTATEKLATAADKPVVPADKPAEGAPPTGKGSAPGVPAQERPAATRFTCLAPTARAVFLAGTFNGWDAKATPMVKDAQGNWEVAVDLPPGRHEFKFAVDGVLCCEPACQGTDNGCPKCVPNSSGTMNRMIEVRSI